MCTWESEDVRYRNEIEEEEEMSRSATDLSLLQDVPAPASTVGWSVAAATPGPRPGPLSGMRAMAPLQCQSDRVRVIGTHKCAAHDEDEVPMAPNSTESNDNHDSPAPPGWRPLVVAIHPVCR